MIWRDAPLYVDAYDLSLALLRLSSKLPSRAFDLLGEDLADESKQLLYQVSLALSAPEQRVAAVEAADQSLLRLRLLLRLAEDLTWISASQVLVFQEKISGMGKMLGGWKKRL